MLPPALKRPWLVLLVGFSLGGARAAARSVEVDVEDSDSLTAEVQQPPTDSARVTRRLAEARYLRDTGRHAEAAMAFHAIEMNGQGGSLRDCAEASYDLAKILMQLGLLRPALSRWATIANDENHPMRLPTLRRLAEGASRISDEQSVVRAIGRYSLADVDRVAVDDEAALKMYMSYLFGRNRYGSRDLERALEAFARVDTRSPRFVEARLYESACHVRLHRSVPALKSLRRAVLALKSGDYASADKSRWLDLLHLSMARIYYSSGIRLHPETNVPRIDPIRFSAAVKYYDEISPHSEHFLAATYERSWVYFMAGDYTQVLGGVHTMNSPYFQDAFYPELDILKAVVYFANCNYDAATIVAARFNKRYIPERDALKRLLKEYDEAFPGKLHVALLEAGERGTNNVIVEGMIRHFRRDRDYLRAHTEVEAINQEQGRLRRLSTIWPVSALGRAIASELAHAKRTAELSRDRLIRDHLQHRVDEIDEHVRNVERMHMSVGIEHRNLLDTKLRSGQVSKLESLRHGVVRADEEHELWPFDGEYWRDELGTYRQTVYSTCGR